VQNLGQLEKFYSACPPSLKSQNQSNAGYDFHIRKIRRRRMPDCRHRSSNHLQKFSGLVLI